MSLLLFIQAANEYIELAQSMETRWQRTLQHERNLRSQLEESLEALAKQMHGLEHEARRTSHVNTSAMEESKEFEHSMNVQFSSISLNVQNPRLPAPKPSFSGEKNQCMPGMVHRLEEAEEQENGSSHSFLGGIETSINEEVLQAGDEEEEEEQFFDAPEASDLSVATATHSRHRRTESAVSVNEAQLSPSEMESVPPENYPAALPDRTIVSKCTQYMHCMQHIDYTLTLLLFFQSLFIDLSFLFSL